MGYDLSEKKYSKALDLTKLTPYGDTMNDGKVQLSFTLPIKNDEKGVEAALTLAKKMGIADPIVAESMTLDNNFTMYVVYGSVLHTINYNKIKVEKIESDVMTKYEVEDFIDREIKRNIVVVGASTGTDAHTVGIDAIMNMKGFAGHYGLERYRNIEAFNMGSQVENSDLIKKAIEINIESDQYHENKLRNLLNLEERIKKHNIEI